VSATTATLDAGPGVAPANLAAAPPGPVQPARPSYFETGWTGGHNPYAIALVVTMATFMEILDTAIANVSLAHIAGSLSVSQDEATWVLTSYLVSNAVVLPISGWIASKIGRKRFYMTCVALFTISSFMCGIAPSLGLLIFFRVLQGVGGGGLGPSEQAILADTFPPAKRGMAFAIYGMAVVLAPAIGPTLGGFITDHYSWRWVFFINVPVGIVSMLLTSRVVTDPPHLKEARLKSGGIDYVGLSLIAVGLGCMEVVLDKGQEEDWLNSHFIITFGTIAAVALVSFVIWEWRHAHPVVDVRMFKSRNFVVTNLMMLTLGMSLFGSTVLLPEFLQILMGYSAQDSGMALSPGGLLIIFMMPMVGTLVSRVDPRSMIAFGFTVLAASLIFMSTHLYLGIDFKTAVLLRMFQSVGLAFLFVPINTLVYSGVPLEKNNAVSGIVNLSRNMGGDIGIAFVTTFVARRAQAHQQNLASHTTGLNAAFATRLNALSLALQKTGGSSVDASKRAMHVLYLQLQQQAATLAYLDCLKVLGLAAACMLPLLFFTQRPKGPAAMGH
jgi:DHA2 family multidrug resistance protein